MKEQLLVVSFLLCASPGIAMFLFGSSNTIQILGIMVVVLAALMVPHGLFTRKGVTTFVLIIMGVVLFLLVLASGYVPIASGLSIGFSSSLIEIVSFSVLLSEIGIVFSALFGNYKAYTNELKKAGYDEEEFRSEFRSFDRLLVLFTLGSAAISIVIYFIFSLVPAGGLDTLTGLVIVAIIYFVIARYILSQRKILSPEHS
jgi:hypothetical protein